MKRSLLLSAIVLIAFTGHAQFSAGVKAGVNFAKEKYSSSTYTTKSHTFFTGGIFGNVGLSKSFAVELSALFSGEGTHESYMSGQNTVTGVVTINRINFPLEIQYKTPVGIYFETGPQLGITTTAKGKYSNSTTTYDFKPNTQSTLFSWCVGAGYMFSTVPGLGIGVSYNAGLSKVNKGTVNANKITASVFSIRASYAVFNSNKKTKKK
jgi:hypothetical protein